MGKNIPYSPGQAAAVKASIYAPDMLAFTGGACLGDYGNIFEKRPLSLRTVNGK